MGEYGKWPRLIVVGEDVTREQASDILVRTDNWMPCVNDAAWERQVVALGEEFGMPVVSYTPGKPSLAWQEINARRERMGVLQLHHLGNARIASSWIGGPHGWCDWDGRIGCSNYNIGKWPCQAEVTEDLDAIAAAFPYLNMHVQLIGDEGEGELLDTWAVKGGKAALVETVVRIDQPKDDIEGDVLGLLFDPGRERGVSLDRLREALIQVRDSRPSS